MEPRHWYLVIGICGSLVLCAAQREEVVDCSNEDIVTSIFNEPIELTRNGTVRVYENVLINEILSTTNNEFSTVYIDARLEFDAITRVKNLVVFTTEHFARYAAEQTAVRITLKIAFGCDRGRERTLIFFQSIREGNYFIPKFSQDVYEVVMPTPIFVGFDLTAFTPIAAHDDDLTNNQLTFASTTASDYFVAIGTKNSTSDDHKTYFASLILNRIYLALAQQIIFNITVTDTGVPPLSSTATVILLANTENSLPPIPRFRQALYNATLNEDLSMDELRVALVTETYSGDVVFSISGAEQVLFTFQQEENMFAVRLARPLNRTEILGRQHLQLEIRAEHRSLADYGRTGVIVLIPESKENFHFDQPLYEGFIDAAGVLHLERIVFNGSNELVSFGLLASNGATLFRFERSGNTLELYLTNSFSLENLLDEEFLRLEVEARLSNQSAATVVYLKLPRRAETPPRQPKFEKPLYTGRIDDQHELLLEAIVLRAETFESNATEILFTRNDRDAFAMIPNGGSIQVALKRPQTIADELRRNATSSLLAVVAARSANLTDFATIIVATGFGVKPLQKVFKSGWYMGSIEATEGAASQQLHLSWISLESTFKVTDFAFKLFGDKAAYFRPTVDSVRNLVYLNMVQALDESLLHGNSTQISLQIRALHISDTAINDTALVFLQLPGKECSPPEPPSLAFDSNEYVFAGKPNQTGLLGHVSATVRGSDASIRYSLDVPTDYLKARLSINALSGDIRLVSSVSPGVYYFAIIALESLVLSSARANARLEVGAIPECDDVRHVVVAAALLTKHIEEEKAHDSVMSMSHRNCTFHLVTFQPNDRPYVYINETTQMLATIAIDREAPIFAEMPEPMIRITLRLTCPAAEGADASARVPLAPGSHTGRPASRFAMDLPYASDTTVVQLLLTDVNDNAPQFTHSGTPLHLGYPEAGIRMQLFPEHLTQLRATDNDSGENAQIRYSLQPNQHFAIDPVSGVVFPKANALRNVAGVELVAVATDRNGGAGGLRTALVLLVQRLSSDYFSLFTLRGNGSTTLPALLSVIGERAGYAISIVKHATLPGGDFDVDGEGARQSGTNAAVIVQSAWTYAFERGALVNCAEFGDKLSSLALGSGEGSVAVASYAEVGLSVGESPPAGDDQATIYIAAIVALSITYACIVAFLMWRANVLWRCCSKTTYAEDAPCQQNTHTPPMPPVPARCDHCGTSNCTEAATLPQAVAHEKYAKCSTDF